MEISLEDFKALADERSQKDVKIARLEMEIEHQAAVIGALSQENGALHAELEEARREHDDVVSLLDEEKFYNSMLTRFILLSEEKVRLFFKRIADVHVLAVVQAFVLRVLPDDISPEGRRLAEEITQLPLPEPGGTVVQVAGNYIDNHDNENVDLNLE